MESRRLVIVLVSLVAVLAATVVVLAVDRRGAGSTTRVGSGHAVAVARTLGPFAGVDLRGTAAVTVRVGATRSVTVRGDDNIVPLLETRVAGGVLVISKHGSFRTREPLIVTVVTPQLSSLRLSGAGIVAGFGIRATTFDASLDGTGRLDLAGTTQALVLRVAGTGLVDAHRLAAQSVRALVAGTGTARVIARRALDARVDGMGSIVYSGHPASVRQHVAGTGTITGS